jgi:tRNA threonylcarbamoyladenosine biosynthesis protein TsaB
MILAIDTAGATTGVALHDGHEVLGESLWVSRGRQTPGLGPEVALLLRRAEVYGKELNAVAVAQGPGSYTGLRAGMAFSKGFALTFRLPLIPVPTLDILAASQPGRPEPLLAVIRAGRGRVAAVWYKWSGLHWEAAGPPANLSWPEVLAGLKEPCAVCGEIDREAREMLRGDKRAILVSPALGVRRPAFLAELAWERFRRGEQTPAAMVKPIYL